tara:strand:+ start:429 stop:1163 length:735 start_codon:yes stop_codon:yes gene_type:complete
MLGLGSSIVTSGAPSEFLPTSISGLQLWLQNGVGITSSSDPAAIDTWADSSGNGNDASHGLDQYRPLLVDGGGDWEGDADADALSLDSTITVNQFHVFVVVAADSHVTNNLLAGSSTTDLLRIGQGSSATSHRLKANNAFTTPAQWSATTSIATDGTKQLLEYEAASGSSNNCFLRINGSLESTVSFDTSANAFDISFVGAASAVGADSFDGNIYEVLIYNSALSAADAANVRNYLNGKLSIYS